MFSHIVVFWTDPEKPGAEDLVLEGAKRLLPQIPQVRFFHAGKMTPSEREVVDQTYQVALNLVFDSREDEAEYQAHPLHAEFVQTIFKPNCVGLKVYDFEG